MEQNTRLKNDKENGVVQLCLNVVGSYFAFKSVYKKLEGTVKLLKSTVYIKVFLQSMLIGFESKMSRMILEAKADPTKSKLKPSSPSPLEEIHTRIQKIFFERAKVESKSFLSDLKAAFNASLVRAQDAEKFLISGVVTGDDFIFNPTDNNLAITRRFRAFCSGEYSYKNPPNINDILSAKKNAVWFALYALTDMAPAVFSAALSAAFVKLDTLGRYFGELIAKVTMDLLNVLPSKLSMPELVNYAVQGTLGVACFYMEGAALCAEYSYDIIKNAFFYPIVSGLTMGLYEEAAKEIPDILNKLQDKENEVKIDDNKSLAQIMKDSYEQAKDQHEKFDKILLQEDDSEKRMQRSLIKNFSSSKKYLETRYVVLSFLDKKLSLIDKKKYIKNIVLAFRSSALIIEVFLSRLVFTATKFITKKVAKPSYDLAKLASRSLIHAISPSKDVEPEKKNTKKLN